MGDSRQEREPGAGGTRGTRGARLGLAVAPDRLVAARLRRAGRSLRVDAVLECPLAPPDGDGWPALAAALRELATELGVAGGSVDVVLLRRLAHTKVVPLPPVRAAELPALVRRAARRHFAVRDEPLVADGSRLAGARSDALVPTLAACAPERVVQAVADACAAAGFRVGRIIPAAPALAEAVCALLPRARRGRVAAVAPGASGTDLVLLDDGIPVRVQPLGPAAGADLAARVREGLAEAEQDGRAVEAVAVCGASAEGGELRAALRADAAGLRLLAAAETEQLPAEALMALGAALARDSVPLLLPPSLAAARARRAARRTAVLAAAAGILLLAAGAIHLQGLRREVDAVRAQRAGIAAAVARAREMRDGVDGMRARLESIAALEAEAAGWTGEIAALAAALPDSAHLATLAFDSAGVRMAGQARSASAVLLALDAHPRFARATLAAPIRVEPGEAGERFDLVAQVQAEAPR